MVNDKYKALTIKYCLRGEKLEVISEVEIEHGITYEMPRYGDIIKFDHEGKPYIKSSDNREEGEQFYFCDGTSLSSKEYGIHQKQEYGSLRVYLKPALIHEGQIYVKYIPRKDDNSKR